MNKLISPLLVFVSLFLIYSSAEAQESCSKIAKINYKNLENHLQELVLSKPQNSDLSVKYKEGEKANKSQQDSMMKRMMEAQNDGEITFNIKDMMKNDDPSEFYSVKMKVEELTRDEFRKIIATSFSDSYDIVIEESWNKEILYSKCPIMDITPQFRQHILKLNN